ncbi:exonuclease domain-containing protein [Clostridium sp. KNHs216]|uniref:exonuclease domain-containing protein n=1 Tax=Clostridium sp. KNHs216 TaxID=1550235 RepID=UPI001169DFC6|nr:DNA polymerase-3 subunit alpha (Gram-positive type) [Clostridium sp. KNHs216]
MNDRYIAFDVETPNYANDRISAIGITVVENGRITYDFYSLVNSEVHFDPFNIRLTGITPEMVADQPAFPELWEKIAPVMGSGLLIAHNAPFDMGVLAQCLNDYGIEWQPFTYYACTCVMGRACYPQLQNHKLNTLCNYLNLNLDHHHAGSDSHACAELLLDYMHHGLQPDRFLRRYDLAQRRTLRMPPKAKPSETTTQLLALKDLLSTITADDELSESEVLSLQTWMNENLALRGNFPFDKIFETVGGTLEDGILEDAELQAMLLLFGQITDPVANTCSCDCFDINGKTFCLTGEFEFGDRSSVESALSQKGGIPVSSVTRKIDCVIVGSRGSDAWSSGNYGTKVKKALELQAKGHPIQIVKEQDICNLLSN